MKSDLPTNAGAQPDCAWTCPSVQKDFADWRAGRLRYAVWAIDLDHAWLRAASEDMRQYCADLLLPDYARQPHLTLRICGFLAPERRRDDDFTHADFLSQVCALKSSLIQPFSIKVGAADTFTTAPYLSVLDIDGGIARARQALAMPLGDGPGEKGLPYVPHVTFGFYGGRFPMPDVVRRLHSNREILSTHVAVKRLVLMTYEASVIAGPLTTVCAFDLEGQTLRAIDPEATEELFR